MEILKNKHQHAINALARFEKIVMAWQLRGMHDYNQDTLEFIADGLVKRFEFTYAAFLCFLEQYVLDVHGIPPKKGSFGVLHQAMRLELISAAEYKMCDAMVRDRNITSHEYALNKSKKVFDQAPQHLSIMRKIVTRLQPPNRDNE